MPETIAQHPPAMKVGGRRLSTTTRPKPPAPEPAKAPTPPAEQERPDYPRPAPPGEQPQHDPAHVHDDHEEIPKKDKKQGHGALEHERRLQESALKKAEQNRPSKNMGAGARNNVGGGGRISQPAGKTFST